MNSSYHPRLQGTPTVRKLNDFRLRVIRLSMLSAFYPPGSKEKQKEVSFKEYHDRVNASLHFEHAQVMGVTAKHLLFQMRWFEKRGVMYPRPSGDPNARFGSIVLSDSAQIYFGEKTPEEILTHFESAEATKPTQEDDDGKENLLGDTQ